MTYQQTIDYLYNRLPVFHNVGPRALNKGLGGITRFCEYLNHPQNSFKTIHIGGTNGKGSSSHMLASILQTQGYKTGLYTSPHLVDFRERIRLNGAMLEQQYVVDFVQKHKEFIENGNFSFFEVTVAMAFQYFADIKVDIAVIEVGLGGRLDSTNIIKPIASLITNISFDHAKILGNTLELIAAEKAGIIKEGIAVVISKTQQETKPIFLQKAKETNSEIVFADAQFQVLNQTIESEYQHLKIKELNNDLTHIISSDLLGSYQSENIIGVLALMQILNKNHLLPVSEESCSNGLKNARMNTQLLGRWLPIANKPTIFCDTGHNEAGILEVLKNINRYKFNKLIMILGFVNDKEINKILHLLPKEAEYYWTQASIFRAKNYLELAQEATEIGLRGKPYETVQSALDNALVNASETDFIFIGGSTFIVADLLKTQQWEERSN